VGSQVEFIHPPIHEDSQERLTTEFIRLLSLLALPDGSHLIDSGHVNFILQNEHDTFHCISCYRQIKTAELTQVETSVNRTFVQKAVVILTKLPKYGELRAKL
jgi:hypothetical protein